MNRKVATYELCDSCLNIRPVMNNGSLGMSIEQILDSPGYRNNPISHIMMNLSVLFYLKVNGGCPSCIDLMEDVNGPDMTRNANEMAALETSKKAEQEKAEKERQEKAEKERKERVEKEKAEIEEIKQRYEQEISSNPNAEVYKKRGYDFIAHGMADEGNQVFLNYAIADFTEALRLNPNDTDAYLGRAGVYSQKKDFDRAIADYDQAIRIDPHNAEAYAFRGGIYFQKGKNNQALPDFNEAIRLNPKCKNAYTFRGGMYFGQAVHNKKNADYDKAVEDIDKAIADIEKALELEPNDTAATYLLEKVRKEKEVLDRICRERQEQYDRLVQEMNKASTEKEYQDLAQKFQKMNGYKDTAELASKCDKQYQELRKKREHAEKIKKSVRKTGRVFAVLLAVFSLIMIIIANSVALEPMMSIVDFIFLAVVLIVPFLVIFLCIGWVKKSICLGLSVYLVIFILIAYYSEFPTNPEIPYFVVMCISYTLSCVVAMVFPKG